LRQRAPDEESHDSTRGTSPSEEESDAGNGKSKGTPANQEGLIRGEGTAAAAEQAPNLPKGTAPKRARRLWTTRARDPEELAGNPETKVPMAHLEVAIWKSAEVAIARLQSTLEEMDVLENFIRSRIERQDMREGDESE